MSFSFQGSNYNVQTGPDIEDIQTEAIGFLAISGESKVQILPNPWPDENPPPPTSSLLAIASTKGILAAAGPEAIVLVTTESLRKAFNAPESGKNHLKRVESLLILPMSFRISQLAFSADEKYLILSAESGGGLAVYDILTLLSGSQQTAFELPTNGCALRAIAPNPTPEKGEYLAIVTMNGNLMMANLNDRRFLSGPEGVVLKQCVSCISWSSKGKQLVAGLGDGTAYQMTPDGEGKAVIPRPPNVGPDNFISSILWLENHMFLLIHSSSLSDPNQVPPASLNLAIRTADCQNYTFQKVSDPAQPFGLNRSPPHYFTLRLRDFPPSLQDLIIMASTTSTDIGLLSRSKVPLTNEKPKEKVTGVFTMTELLDDSRRAQLPLSISGGDTSPIGVGLDLSSRVNVTMPIPGDEITESSNPIPALMVLNNEGILASWWIIYSESVRENTIYPGLVVAAKQDPKPTVSVNSPPSAVMDMSADSQTFGSTNTPTFGMARPTSVFGSPSQPGPTSVFGATSSLGRQAPTWGISSNQNTFHSSKTSFGDPAFSLNSKVLSLKPAFGVPEFGKASTPSFGLGASMWGTAMNTTGKSTFGNVDGENNQKESTQTPFAAYISGPGFMGASKSTSESRNFFESKPSIGGSSFSQVSTQVNEPVGASIFGSSNSEKFVVGSTFKADTIEKSQSEGSTLSGSNNFFNDTFVGDLPTAATSQVAASAEPKEIHDESKENLEYQNILLAETTITNNTPSTPSTPLFLPSSASKTTDSSSALVEMPMVSSPRVDLVPEKLPDNNMFGAAKSSQKNYSVLVKQESLPKSMSNQILVPEAPLPPHLSIKDSPSVRKSAQITPIPESPRTPEVTYTSQSNQRHSNHYSTSPSDEKNETVKNQGVLNFEDDHELIPSSSLSAGEEEVPHEKGFDDRTEKSIYDGEEHPAQTTEADDVLEGQVSVEQSSSTDSPCGPEDDGISLSDDVDGDIEDEDDEDSQAGTDDFREEENQVEITKNSIHDAEGNQLAGLSPESSYDIVEHSLLENTDLIKSSEPALASKFKKSFSEVELITHKTEECPSSPTLIRKANSSNSVHFETRKASSTIDGVLQSSGAKNKIVRYDKRDAVKGTRLVERKQREEGNTQTDFMSLLKSEEERYNEILALKEKEKKHQAELAAQVEEEEKRRNKIKAEIKAEEKRHQELVSQREAEEKRRNQIIAQTKAEERKRNQLVAQWEAEEKRHEELKAQKEAMEKQALVDEDDMYMQSYLASDIDRTTTLNDFVAHSDYVSTISDDSIPAQVETVYRDINSMIDTLGLNSRSLKEFMLGHSEGCKRERRNRDDLNDYSNWVLEEIKALSNVVEKDLTHELENGRIRDFEKKIEAIKELQNDLRKLRAKHFDIKKIVATSQDPHHISMARSQPLGASDVAQQQILRRDFMKFQRLLSEVEEGLAILKAKIVAQSTSHGRSGNSNGLTVEAIMRTITKLTSMAEKKSGDIDVLEGQIRKLKLNSSATGMSYQETLLTPLKRRSSHRNSIPNTYGIYTPERAKCSPFQNSLISSSNSLNQISPPRRKLSGYSKEEKHQLRQKLDRKKEVINKLRSNLGSIGVTVSIMDSLD